MALAFPSFALVRRELLTLLRGPRPMGLLLLSVSAAAIFVWVNWPENLDRLRWAPYLAQAYLTGIVVMLFCGTLLCVPAFAAGAIVLERERGTFDLVRMTLARPAGLVLSKMVNAVGFFLLLLVGIGPAAGTIFFLVGVDLRQFAGALLIIAMTAVTCASIGLLASAVARRSLVAIGLSYLGVLAAVLVPTILAFIVAAALAILTDVRSVLAPVEQVFNIVMPLAAFEDVFGSGAGARLAPHLLYQAFVSLVCLVFAWRLVARPQAPPKVELRKPVDDAKMLRERRTNWPYYLIDPLRRKKPIEDGRNAMLVREVRWGLINRGSILVRLFYVSAAVYFFVGIIVSTDNARMYNNLDDWFYTQIVLTLLVAPALTANAVTKESELGNLDMLRVTQLRPREIVVGKYVAAFFSLCPVLLAAVVSLVPVWIMVRPDWRVVVMGYGTLLVCSGLSLSIAVFFSTAMRRTLPAIVWSYVLSVFVYLGFALAAMWGADYENGRAQVSPYVYWYSPLYTLDRGLSGQRAGEYGIGFWLVGMGVWVAISSGLIALSVWIFSRYRMQDR